MSPLDVRNTSTLPGQSSATSNYWLNGGVFHAEPFPRHAIVTANQAALTTQICTGVRFGIDAGEVIRYFSFLTGTTAAGTPTNWWLALYDPSGALVCSTADQLTGAIAASTAFDVAVGRDVNGNAISSYSTTTPGLYTVSLMVKATTVPTLQGNTLAAGAASAISARQQALAVTHGSALTTTPPATVASPTTVATAPYLAVHF